MTDVPKLPPINGLPAEHSVFASAFSLRDALAEVLREIEETMGPIAEDNKCVAFIDYNTIVRMRAALQRSRAKPVTSMWPLPPAPEAE